MNNTISVYVLNYYIYQQICFADLRQQSRVDHLIPSL